VRRGSLTLWIDEDIARWWLSQSPSGKPSRPGARETYSDKAIEVCLCLRVLLKLPLRQTEGFVRSLLCLAGLSLPVPDYSTLSRRHQDLPVYLGIEKTSEKTPLSSGPLSSGPLDVAPAIGTVRHLVIDSTGLKVSGEGEWKIRKHGSSSRRKWKKIHLAVDQSSGEVFAVTVTDGDGADGPQLPGLVEQSQRISQAKGDRIGQVSADGAYDSWANDAFLTQQGIIAAIPPRAGSKIRRHGNSHAGVLQRDENLRQIRKLGRKGWARVSGYTRRCLAETQMMRQKRLLGGSLASRVEANQATECRLRCAVLNRLTRLGMPDSYPVYVK
jgi:hypothetical protein